MMSLAPCPNCGAILNHYNLYPVDGIVSYNGVWQMQRIVECPACHQRIHGITEIYHTQEEAQEAQHKRRSKKDVSHSDHS